MDGTVELYKETLVLPTDKAYHIMSTGGSDSRQPASSTYRVNSQGHQPASVQSSLPPKNCHLGRKKQASKVQQRQLNQKFVAASQL